MYVKALELKACTETCVRKRRSAKPACAQRATPCTKYEGGEGGGLGSQGGGLGGGEGGGFGGARPESDSRAEAGAEAGSGVSDGPATRSDCEDIEEERGSEGGAAPTFGMREPETMNAPPPSELLASTPWLGLKGDESTATELKPRGAHAWPRLRIADPVEPKHDLASHLTR